MVPFQLQLPFYRRTLQPLLIFLELFIHSLHLTLVNNLKLVILVPDDAHVLVIRPVLIPKLRGELLRIDLIIIFSLLDSRLHLPSDLSYHVSQRQVVLPQRLNLLILRPLLKLKNMLQLNMVLDDRKVVLFLLM